jgi:hypothetical protein
LPISVFHLTTSSAAALLCAGLAAVGFLALAADVVLAAVVDGEHVDIIGVLLLMKLGDFGVLAS